MKANRTLLILLGGLCLCLAPTAVAGPPVRVDVLVDEAEDDFFRAAPPGEPRAASSTSKGEGQSQVNTQVVNVNVYEQAPSQPDRAAPTPPPEPTPPAGEEELTPRVEQKVESWWRVPSHARAGDVLVAPRVGYPMSGLGLEVMLSDRWALQLNVAGKRLEGAEADEDALGGLGGFGVPQLLPGTRSSGFAHAQDLSVAFHFLPRSRWDLYASAGLGHVGYRLRAEGADPVTGGSGYGRLGAGLAYHYRRFFVGIDLGWYPLEVLRYRIDEGERSAQAIPPGDRGEWVALDARRVMGSWRFGLRF